MKIIRIIATACLVFIGSFLRFEKIEVNDITESKQIKVKEEIIEENVIMEIVDDKEKTISSNNNIESTKKKDNKTDKNTTKIESKIKINNKKETKNNRKKEETKKEALKEEKPKENPKPQCSDFYESITHGKVDKSSRSACVSYGNKIQTNELNEVLDYNEEHGNTKKPSISYFRCFEVVDNNCNTKGWYLHFFCNSGDCNDSKLKSLYG
ncbi:MAG: hypothetical protein IJ399_00420 [Bacilli bacterium]|nr:hypothetical protein [Bacilli bacterium]